MASLVERVDDLTGRSLVWRCGHERTDENTASGQCRTCRNERQRRYDSDPKRRAAIYARAKARRAANPKGKAALNARITALEAMCETLAGAFLETREMLGLAEQIVCEECCPTTWKTADGQPHCKLHEDIRAVLLRHEATRDQALTQYRAMKERNDAESPA